MAINTNLVKFRRGTYSDNWAKQTGRDASTLYFAEHNNEGVGGLWLGDKLISSQVVDATLSGDGQTLTIKKLNEPGSASAYSEVIISLSDTSTAISSLETRIGNIETILDNNQSTTSKKLNEIDASISDLSTNKADKTENWWSFTGGTDASAKLDGIEAGAQVNKLEAVKLNGNFVNIQTDETNGKYVDLGSIATSTALDDTMAEAKKHSEVQADANNTMVGVVVDGSTADGGTIYKVYDSSLRTKLGNMDTSIADATDAAAAAQADVDALEASVGVIPAASSASTVIGYVDEKVASAVSDSSVSVSEAAGSGDVLKVYTISQGGNTVGTINIPKDLVATQGELVYCTKSGNTYTEATASTEGAIACIKMTIQNGDPFYIEVQDLIEYNSVTSNSEITLTDTGHVIEATVGNIVANKISWQNGANSTDVSTALADLYSQIGAGGSVATQIQEAVEALDSSVTATGTAQNNGVFVISKVNEVDGLLDQNGSTFVEVEQAGAAAAAKSTIDAYTVNGKAISTNPVLDGADLYVDASAQTTETIKHAIERLDGAVGSQDVSTQIANAVDALDATTTATGTAQYDNNGASIFVLSQVNEVDGKLTAVDANDSTKSQAVEVWSAEATKELSDALTWGSFSNS